MYDSEFRLDGARFFLNCAGRIVVKQNEYKWYIQAAASFVIAASEISYHQYGVDNKIFEEDSEESRFGLKSLKEKFPECEFFQWLFRKLEMDLLHDRKSPNGRRYDFLRNERNDILHRGENDKKIVESEMFFDGWDSEPCAIVCEKTIEFIQSIIDEAKKSGYI